MARSRRSLDTAPLMSATRSMPSRTRLTSCRTNPAIMSTTAGRWIGSSLPTAPKSIRPNDPSDRTKTLPGWGSAWKKPCFSTCWSADRSRLSARAPPIGGRGRQLVGVGRREALEALLDQHTPGAQLGVHLGDPDPGAVAVAEHDGHFGHGVGLAQVIELVPQALGELAEDLPRSHATPEGSTAFGQSGHVGERRQVPLDDPLDVGPLDLDDHGLTRMKPGPVGLADRGGRERLPVEVGEHGVDRVAELGLEHRLDVLGGLSGHAILQLGELAADLRWHQVDPRRRDLADLHVDPARLLEHLAEAHPYRLGRTLGLSAGCQQGPEAVLSGQADQLAVAPIDVDATADRRDRSGCDDQSGSLGGRKRPRAGQQVDRHGDGHGRRDRDRQRVHHQPIRPPVPVGQAQGQQPAEDPPDRPRNQRGRPAPAHPEQPEGERRRNQRHRGRKHDPHHDLNEARSDHHRREPYGPERRHTLGPRHVA